MNESVTKITAQIKEQYQKLSPKTKRLAIIVLCGVIITAVIISVVLNSQPYETLFTGLSSQELTEVTAKLTEMEAAYKLEADGTIKVKQSEEPTLKAQLVSEGYPKSGLTYDIFKSNISMMSTDFEKTSYKLFDLQDRIAATIRMFDGVKESIVVIALGEEKKYVLEEDKTESSATVTVIMQNGGSPTQDQVNGIRRLVSKSVAGMKDENVVILDGSGAEMTSDEQNTQLGAAQLKSSLENSINNSVKANILNLLSPIYNENGENGENNVRVSVRSTVDVDKKIKEIIEYLPSEDNKGVISREDTGTEIIRDGETTGGTAGTESNSEVPIYSGIELDGSEVYFNDQKTIDYLVSQTKEQIQSDSGIMTDLTISIAVNGSPEDNTRIGEIKKAVALAAGIDPDKADSKVSLLYAEFKNKSGTDGTGDPSPNPSYLSTYLLYGGIAFVVLLILFIIIMRSARKSKRKKSSFVEADKPENIILSKVAEVADTLLNKNDNTKESKLKDEIGQFTDSNPEIAAQLIKTWLKGGDEA